MTMQDIADYLTNQRGLSVQSWLVEENRENKAIDLLNGIGEYDAFNPEIASQFLIHIWTRLYITSVTVGCYPAPTLWLNSRERFTKKTTILDPTTGEPASAIRVAREWLDADNVFIEDGILKIWWS
jgi:hypothetical protein